MTFRCLAVCALWGLAALVIAPPCAAQRTQAPNSLKQISAAPPDAYALRTDAFRRLLFELGFHPLHSFTQLQEGPSEALFIMLGNPSCLSNDHFPKGLRSFVEQGGAVLIATDMETKDVAGKNLRELAGVTVTGETLVVSPPPHVPQSRYHFLYNIYNNSKYCPFVEPLEDGNVLDAVTNLVGVGGRPDLFRRYLHADRPRFMQKVATNAPSRLAPLRWFLPDGIRRLAKLPKWCQDEKNKERHFVDEKGPLFAVGGTVGKGRVVVLADHSIFINRMVLPRDNDNLEFTVKCLLWLRGEVSTPTEMLRALNNPDERSHAEHGNEIMQRIDQRNKVLFWDDGVIRKDFAVPLERMPAPAALPSEPVIVAAIDKTITKLEESNSFNRALLQQMDEMPGGREGVVRKAVYLLTLAALVLLGYRFLWRTRYRPEFAVPSLSQALRAHEPKMSLLEQRRRALLRLGNVWEMGHRLARECFESAGVALTSASPPRVLLAQGSRWQRWCINRRVARLWRLARGDAPARLSPTALKHRLRELEELQTALANGTITLG
jgi:hypothetical protein